MTLMSGCSDLLDTRGADAVIRVEAEDQQELDRIKSELLDTSGSWDGTRVGETTAEDRDAALEFSLPGRSLNTALAVIGDLPGDVIATEIDVDAEQLDRTPTSQPDEGRAQDPPDQVRLRVELTQAPSAGLSSLFRLTMFAFSIVGMVTTVRWANRKLRPGRERAPRRRRVDRVERVDLSDGPPTAEHPRIPREP
jgi:hypothetical protein